MVGANPAWGLRTDARLTSLTNLITILVRTQLGIEFLDELLDEDWWQEHFPRSMPDEAKDPLTSVFEESVKFSFGMDVFSGVEIYFRIFLRALCPTACNGATDAFKNIYCHLLGPKRLGFCGQHKQASIELLEFVRLIRNLIHNASFYYDRTGNDKAVLYRGKTYKFQHGRVVDFVFWDLLLTMTGDMLQLLVEVISHPTVRSLTQVDDPLGVLSGGKTLANP